MIGLTFFFFKINASNFIASEHKQLLLSSIFPQSFDEDE